MPTYQIPVRLPGADMEAFIEHLTRVAAADAVVVTIEAKDRREAARLIIAELEEFQATYRGDYLDEERKQNVRDDLKVIRPENIETGV